MSTTAYIVPGLGRHLRRASAGTPRRCCAVAASSPEWSSRRPSAVDVSRPDDEESADAAPVDDGRPTLDVTPRTGEHTRSSGGSGTRKYLAIGGLVVLLGGARPRGVQRPDRRGDLLLQRRRGGRPAGRRSVTSASGCRATSCPAPSTRPTRAWTSCSPSVTPRSRSSTRVIRPSCSAPTSRSSSRAASRGDEFVSDEILIRHDSTYEEENGDRLREAQEDADRRASGAG